MAKKRWDELTKDELFERIDQCAQYVNYLDLAGIPIDEDHLANATYKMAENELKTRFGLTSKEEILQETRKWVKEQYRTNYASSYCVECPANPGFDKLVDETPLECTAVTSRRMYYGFPDKKELCGHASSLDSKCK
jgi:hypothetical protein